MPPSLPMFNNLPANIDLDIDHLDNNELLKRIESFYERQRREGANKKSGDLYRRYRTIALYLRKLEMYCISLPEVNQWSDALLESLLPQSGKVVAGANRPWYKYTAQWIKETEENVWAMDHISNYYCY